MTLKSYLWGMRAGALLSLAAWVLIITQIDPEKSGIFGQVLFFISTFLLFAGLLVLFFTWLRRRLGGNGETAFIYLGVSFRQGILIAFLLILLLLLQRFRVLTFWDSSLMVAGIFLVELYFLTRK